MYQLDANNFIMILSHKWPLHVSDIYMSIFRSSYMLFHECFPLILFLFTRHLSCYISCHKVIVLYVNGLFNSVIISGRVTSNGRIIHWTVNWEECGRKHCDPFEIMLWNLSGGSEEDKPTLKILCSCQDSNQAVCECKWDEQLANFIKEYCEFDTISVQ